MTVLSAEVGGLCPCTVSVQWAETPIRISAEMRPRTAHGWNPPPPPPKCPTNALCNEQFRFDHIFLGPN